MCTMYMHLNYFIVFIFIDAEREEEKRGYALNGFNQFRSDRLPLDREVPDTREPK